MQINKKKAGIKIKKEIKKRGSQTEDRRPHMHLQ